jgi:hypothetical protein
MAYSNLFKFWLYLIQKKSYNTLFLCDSSLSHSTFFVARHFFVALSTQLLQYIMLIFFTKQYRLFSNYSASYSSIVC